MGSILILNFRIESNEYLILLQTTLCLMSAIISSLDRIPGIFNRFFSSVIFSISLALFGNYDEALYSAHWPGTILLFAIAIRQRRTT